MSGERVRASLVALAFLPQTMMAMAALRWTTVIMVAASLLLVSGDGWGQLTGYLWGGFAGNPQHTATSTVTAQELSRIRWKSPVDLHPQYSGNDLLIHYGSPVVTASNTVIVPVKTGATGGFRVEARNGKDGRLRWTLNSDYLLPPHDWTPSFNPVLTPSGQLYFPGAGGTVQFRDQPDSNKGLTGRIAFYGLANYTA